MKFPPMRALEIITGHLIYNQGLYLQIPTETHQYLLALLLSYGLKVENGLLMADRAYKPFLKPCLNSLHPY